LWSIAHRASVPRFSFHSYTTRGRLPILKSHQAARQLRLRSPCWDSEGNLRETTPLLRDKRASRPGNSLAGHGIGLPAEVASAATLLEPSGSSQPKASRLPLRNVLPN
jgi:hypothetical protein